MIKTIYNQNESLIEKWNHNRHKNNENDIHSRNTHLKYNQYSNRLNLVRSIVSNNNINNRKRTIFSNYHNNNNHHEHENLYNNENNKKNVNNSSLNMNNNNIQRDYIAAVIGKEVQLDCKMKNLINDDDKIVWLKMPKGEVLTLNSNRVTQDMRLSTKCLGNSVPCWSLIISNTRESDTGFYVCQTNAMQTKYVYLDIMGNKI